MHFLCNLRVRLGAQGYLEVFSSLLFSYLLVGLSK